MPVVAVVVGAIGSAVGSAIAGSLVTSGVLGATIAGVATATIGAAIGAGIAGGALSAATGGSFGDGFFMGAAGNILGGFLKGGLGDSLGGATQFADGTTSAELFAAQGGAEFAPDALSGLGDVSSASSGLGEIGAFTDIDTGVQTFAAPDAPDITGQELTPESIGSTENTFGSLNTTEDFLSQKAIEGDYVDQGMFLGNSTETNPYTFETLPDSPLVSEGMDYAPTSSPSTLEGIGQAGSQHPTGVTSSSMLLDQGGQDFAPNNAPTSQGGLQNMFKSSDSWLKNTFGLPQGSTGKLLLGGADSLYKLYETNKLENLAKGTAPLSFEQFKKQYTDPNAYKVAANRMAMGGRTGTLPALLARMQNDARGKYASYLPNAKQQYLNNMAGISQAKVGSLQNLFSPLFAGY